MRTIHSYFYSTVTFCLFICLVSCKTEQVSTKSFSLTNELDSVSYSLGMSVALGVKSQGIDSLSQNALSKAFRDVFAEDSLLVTEENANRLLTEYFQSLTAKVGEKNLEMGRTFLEKNKSNEGVITTASGLQYKIIESGTGAIPSASDQVTTHYTGTTISGEVFDSSVERGEPATFPINGVIPGWTEALQIMPVGSKWKLFIPSELAYGARGAGPKIGPNSVLIFDIELISIN
ncbi:MAG: FKBP-type peptidyl-prolyl cis-trans isomerase [Reichenbachiella sp.]|uniref:FKBP-type peptidyl-prolyl cis-trans isomerase n=1 Tax=Reichenbachiella sp. TaxID=2184521 RepID=UPI003265D45E